MKMTLTTKSEDSSYWVVSEGDGINVRHDGEIGRDLARAFGMNRAWSHFPHKVKEFLDSKIGETAEDGPDMSIEDFYSRYF